MSASRKRRRNKFGNVVRTIGGHHQRLGARRQICGRWVNQNISQHRANNCATGFASHHCIESRRQSLDMRAFAATLKTLERDVFTQTHTATIEGGCYSVLLLLAPTVLAVFFLDFNATFLLGLATALAAGFLLGAFAAFLAPRFAGFLPPFDAV